MIVVTGSSGRVGGLVARRLASEGHPMRLLVRDPERAPRIAGAQVQAADYGDPQALEKGLGADGTLVLEPVINVEPIWKMNTALGSPWASSVTLPDDSSSELLAVRTPGEKVWPARSVPADPLLGREAASL